MNYVLIFEVEFNFNIIILFARTFHMYGLQIIFETNPFMKIRKKVCPLPL